MKAAVGRSEAHDAAEAGRAAAHQALTELGVTQPCLALVFATVGYDQTALLGAVRGVIGEAPLAGCSGEGVISQDGSCEGSHAVCVLMLTCPDIAVDTFLVADYGADANRCAEQLAEQVCAADRADAKLLLVFPDGLTGNCTQFLRRLDAKLPNGIRVVGGAAGDMMKLEKTYQYRGGEALSDAVAAVLLSGNFEADIAVSHGCTPIGLQREVTQEVAGWVETIDGERAWDVFREYLDGNPSDLSVEQVNFLCLGEPLPASHAHAYDRYIIRQPLALNKDSGALFFPGGLQLGSSIVLTRRDPERITASARECASQIHQRHANKPDVVLQFDCAGRGRSLFGARTNAELIDPLQEELGHDVPWIGFHTFGEIAALESQTYYHNNTVVLCALYAGS